METTRQSKVGKQIQKDLSEIVLPMSRNFGPGKMLTITQVRISPDLSMAKAYISVFPSENSQAIVDELNLQISPIRNELGKRIRHQVKKVPTIKFYLDDSLDYINNIDGLLK